MKIRVIATSRWLLDGAIGHGAVKDEEDGPLHVDSRRRVGWFDPRYFGLGAVSEREGTRRQRRAKPRLEALEDITSLSAGVTPPAALGNAGAQIDASRNHAPAANPRIWGLLATALEERLSLIVSETEAASIGRFRQATIKTIETEMRSVGVAPYPGFASFLFSTIRPDPATRTVTVTGVLGIGRSKNAVSHHYAVAIVVTDGVRPRVSIGPQSGQAPYA